MSAAGGTEGLGTVDLFLLSSSLCSAIFWSVGPQANAKYLKYFEFLQMGEAGGPAATAGPGTVDLFFSSSFCSAIFWSVGPQANAKYLEYF